MPTTDRLSTLYLVEGCLVCFQREREGGEVVPGCNGIDASATDYCVNPDSFSATYPTLTEVMGGKKFPTEEDRLATWDEKKHLRMHFDECEGVCCVTDECKSGECFWRNEIEGAWLRWYWYCRSKLLHSSTLFAWPLCIQECPST